MKLPLNSFGVLSSDVVVVSSVKGVTLSAPIVANNKEHR